MSKLDRYKRFKVISSVACLAFCAIMLGASFLVSDATAKDTIRGVGLTVFLLWYLDIGAGTVMYFATNPDACAELEQRKAEHKKRDA